MASIAVFTQSNSVLFDDEKINRDKIPLLSLDSSLSTASSLRTSGFFDKENDEYNQLDDTTHHCDSCSVSSCDACVHCEDICCSSSACESCTPKQSQQVKIQYKNLNRPITMCQLRRNNNEENGIWILCGKDVYDATEYVKYHPGGAKSILRKSGGIVDCTRDMKFHSPRAINAWKQMKIGVLVPCPGEGLGSDDVSSNKNEQGGCTIS